MGTTFRQRLYVILFDAGTAAHPTAIAPVLPLRYALLPSKRNNVSTTLTDCVAFPGGTAIDAVSLRMSLYPCSGPSTITFGVSTKPSIPSWFDLLVMTLLALCLATIADALFRVEISQQFEFATLGAMLHVHKITNAKHKPSGVCEGEGSNPSPTQPDRQRIKRNRLRRPKEERSASQSSPCGGKRERL